MDVPGWIIAATFMADLGIRIGVSIRVIMRRLPVGVSLAWLFIIMAAPFAGALLYLFIGELRLGRRRENALRVIGGPVKDWLQRLREQYEIDWNRLGHHCEPLARLSERAAGIPALPDNRLQLLSDWKEAFDSIIADIDHARKTCQMEFYIWNPEGVVADVTEALLRARQRGVDCKVLVDAVGSKRFLASAIALRMREHGVEVRSALSGGLFHWLVKRFDLRMHRKIIVIDGEIAYTGSLNLVDPRFFKQNARVGQWVDAMVRMEGPAVEPLTITFLTDWALENAGDTTQLLDTDNDREHQPRGASVVQVVPTGPTSEGDAIQILIMAMYAAQQELTITTPYFVPDEAVLTALVSASRRGVDVTIVLPTHVDSKLVRLAGQPHMGQLLENGVRIMQFDGGLLHTKSITVDREMTMFGSLNVDPRSIYLNFEITLNVYDRTFTSKVHALQQLYISESHPMTLQDWQGRRPIRRLADNVARLLSPLL